ncbi:MAG: SRPBCC domain-containing protein [Proteobacteria bacterium]|nr:SRPBCC domain-containing protein [Pseudomonadota bacterium]
MGIEISQFAVRRAVHIAAEPRHVWHEFHDARRMSDWFGRGHSLDVYEPGKDGRMELSVNIGDEVVAFGGNIVVFDEDRELSFENNWFGPRAWAVPTFITIRLTSMYDGTLVELFHHGFERLGAKGAAEYLAYESGWDTLHLKALKQIVEGR